MSVDEWNDEMQALALRWAAWRRTPFPGGCRGVNIDECELILIDAEIAMLVECAVERRPLGKGGVASLTALLEQLRQALPLIPGGGPAYFGELAAIADAAIRLSRAAAGYGPQET